MLLIKYDGITNIRDAIKRFHNVTISDTTEGKNAEGYYYIDDDNTLHYSYMVPDASCYVYTSTQVSKWRNDPLIDLPVEIRQLARKYVTSDESMKARSVVNMTTWSITDEGFDFWINVNAYRFDKAFKYLANHKNLLTDRKTKNHETKLQDKTSSSRAGAEPKGSVISCKKSFATIASGHLEYGRSIRG